MENTTGKYSTSTYEYYKNMIEMEVGWLQFLASFGKLKDFTSYDLEDKLVLVKQSMIQGIDEFIKHYDTDSSRKNYMLIKDALVVTLREYNLEGVASYINLGINDEDYNDFITMLYIRKFIKSIGIDLRELNELLKSNTNEEAKAIKMMGRELNKISPEVSIESAVVNDSLMGYFIGETGVRYSKDGSSNAYIAMVLMLLERINAYVCYMIPSDYKNEVSDVSKRLMRFEDLTYIKKNLHYYVSDLIGALDGIRNNIKLLKKVLSSSLNNASVKTLVL